MWFLLVFGTQDGYTKGGYYRHGFVSIPINLHDIVTLLVLVRERYLGRVGVLVFVFPKFDGYSDKRIH